MTNSVIPDIFYRESILSIFSLNDLFDEGRKKTRGGWIPADYLRG